MKNVLFLDALPTTGAGQQASLNSLAIANVSGVPSLHVKTSAPATGWTEVVLSDGNKGDITVTVGGTVWTLNAGSVDSATIDSGAATSGKVLTANGGGGATWETNGAGTVTGSGTVGFVPQFDSATALGDSDIEEAGTYFNYGNWALYSAKANGNTGITGGFYAPGVPSTAIPSIDADRVTVASAQDAVGAIRGRNRGTFNTTAASLFAYGAEGRAYGTKSAGANYLHNWGVFGYGSGSDSCGGITGYAYGGEVETTGGIFRGHGQSLNSVVFGVCAQADTDGTGTTFGLYGHSRTGNIRVGCIGLAVPGGATTNIGVYGTIEAYTTTAPAGTWAGYFKGDVNVTGTLSALSITQNGTALATVATSGSASDLGTGTLPIGRIADAAVTLAKMADLAGDTIIGRASGEVAGVPTALTAAQTRTILGLATVATSGSASDLGTGTLPIARVADAAVTLAKMADLAADTIIGRANGAATGVPTALTAAEVNTILPVATATAKGLVPVPPNNTTTFLRGDATFAVPTAQDSRLTTKLLGSTYTNDTAVATEVTGLSQSLAAGTYNFEYGVIFQANHTSSGLKASVNFDGTQTMLLATGVAPSTTSNSLDQDQAVVTTWNGFSQRAASTAGVSFGNSSPNLDTANVNIQARITGTIIVTVTGNLELWTAQASDQGILSVVAGSWLIVTQLS